MFCPKCGSQIADGSLTCPGCGEYIGSQPAPQDPADPAMIPPAQPPQYYQPQGAYPQYPQPPYPQAGYQPYAPYPQQPYGAAAGDGAATASIVCGAIGIFVFGLILGIIAIVQGNKAKSLGYRGGKATAGIVLGVLDLIGWAVIIIAMIAGALVNL